MKFECILEDEAHTINVAQQFAAKIEAPMKIYFSGEIGAGKSCFIRAMLQQLGITQKIKSPTFSIIETYEHQDVQYIHIDLYRLEDEEEYLYLGGEEYFHAKSVVLVEWPEKISLLPPPDIFIRIENIEFGQKRKISIQSVSKTLNFNFD